MFVIRSHIPVPCPTLVSPSYRGEGSFRGHTCSKGEGMDKAIIEC